MRTKSSFELFVLLPFVCVLWSGLTQGAALASTTTTLAVTSAGSPVTSVAAGAVVTLTATVVAGSTPVTPGIVNFCDATATYCEDAQLLGSAQLTSTGTAVMKFRPAVGSHSYKAVFAGTTTYAGSASSASSLTVGSSAGYPTLTVISSQGTTPGPYNLAATVNSAGAVAPTGSVSFLDASNGNAVVGTGTLGSAALGPQSIPVPGAAEMNTGQFAVGDFNGDGIADLAILNAAIYLGNGDGTFRLATSQPAGGLAGNSITAGDFNSDGIEDILVGTAAGVTVYVGNGDGTFTTQVNSALAEAGDVLGTADFNGDGIEDMVIEGSAGIGVALGVGDGTFTEPSAWYSGTSAVMGDFNGDGYEDFAAAEDCCTLTVYLNTGDGAFISRSSTDFSGALTFVGAADFNGDGQTDLAVSYETDFGFGLIQTFLSGTTPTSANTGGQLINNGVVGDFNGDGIPDVWTADSESPILGSVMFVGKGDGTFTPEPFQQFPLQPESTGLIGAADLNGDGIPDVILGGEPILLTMPQSTSATLSGITFPLNSGTHQVVASYTGDTGNATSTSLAVGLQSGGVVFSATSLSFAATKVGGMSGSQVVVVTNTGSEALSISSIAVTGAGASSFDFANSCGTSLGAGASCTIHGHFAPVRAGALTASVTITDNAENSPQTIALSGTGVEPPVTLSTTSVSFAPTNVGGASGSQFVTVTNSGTAALSITSIAVTGANASSFVFANSCGGSLAIGATCTVHGHFAPTTAGALVAAITITDSASTSPQTIALGGTGVEQPVTLSATSLSFGSTRVGATSGSQFVTLTNNGSAALSITSIAVTGTNASSFVFANSCGASLAAGANCSIHGHFAPTATGVLTAAVTITDGASTSPQTIALSGTGLSAAPVTLSATSLTFPATAVGSASASDYVTMTNNGTAALTITSIAVTGADGSSFVFANNCGTSLAVGASCSIHGHFAPVVTGALTAAVTITDSAVGSPQTIALSGTGQ